RDQSPKNDIMLRRATTLTFVAIFLATILCAVVCPNAQASPHGHACAHPDHSCCPKTNDPAYQCVDTHFLGASKYHHATVDVAALLVNRVAPPAPALVANPVDGTDALVSPPRDLVTQKQILRI